MEPFDDIRKKEFSQLTGEIGRLGRNVVELGWSREQVLTYVKELLTEPTAPASENSKASRKED